jgi:hypothetical protein
MNTDSHRWGKEPEKRRLPDPNQAQNKSSAPSILGLQICVYLCPSVVKFPLQSPSFFSSSSVLLVLGFGSSRLATKSVAPPDDSTFT